MTNNMKKTLIVGGTIIILLLSLLVWNAFQIGQPEGNLSSVAISGEYKYTQLSGSVATSSTEIKANDNGTFGSIVITADAASGAIVVYDATSTEALSGTSTLYSRIADLEDGLVEGTYTFDVSFYNGLVLDTTDWTAFAGDWTVTYR